MPAIDIGDHVLLTHTKGTGNLLCGKVLRRRETRSYEIQLTNGATEDYFWWSLEKITKKEYFVMALSGDAEEVI
ncbi:MAG: hypothetical protein ACTSPB_21450 [Candidatus Thorarchaeota archaeon]